MTPAVHHHRLEVDGPERLEDARVIIVQAAGRGAVFFSVASTPTRKTGQSFEESEGIKETDPAVGTGPMGYAARP